MANKSDLHSQQEISFKDITAVAKHHEVEVRMTSAKTGENVQDTFISLVRLIDPTTPSVDESDSEK